MTDFQVASYFWNPVWSSEDPRTCSFCATMIDNIYKFCFKCKDWNSLNIIDKVIPLSLAGDDQVYHDVISYKNSYPTSEKAKKEFQLLLAHNFTKFRKCIIGNEVTPPISYVPSTKGKIPHPIAEVLKIFNQQAPRLVPELNAMDNSGRTYNPKRWKYSLTNEIPKHVLLFDDLWVTGQQIMSVGAALKAAGVEKITAVVFARKISPENKYLKSFSKTYPRIGYDLNHCPIHGKNSCTP